MFQLLYPWYPLVRRQGEPQSQSGHCGKEKKFLPLPGIKPQFLDCHSPLLAAFVTVYSFFIFMYQLLWLGDISQ
jgi:hypothetical protein